MKRNRSLAVRLVKLASRSKIGILPRHQVVPLRQRKPTRDKIRDDQ